VRLFVAIEVGSADPAGPHREAPEHLTLRFVGEVAPDRLEGIAAKLASVAAGMPPFELVLEGVGAFPSRKNPRVVWIGVSAGREEATELAGRVAAALDETAPNAPREEFVPHLTLFRVRSPGARRRAFALLEGTAPPPPRRRVEVRELHLKESTLAPEGAHHRTVGSWTLAGPRTPPRKPEIT
jgi:RNA 2',3'-cyclic 3'-phosphodiesterase